MSEKLTAEEALRAVSIRLGLWATQVDHLASLGFALIPTDPDSPKMVAAVEAGAKALQPKAYTLKTLNLWQLNAARKAARACLIAALEELKKP